jgi:hypothetical protein
MPELDVPLKRLTSFGKTERRDAWWAFPALTFVVFSGFLVYATWAAFQGVHYDFGPYISPFYSPLIFGEGPHAWFAKPSFIPSWLPFTGALVILWAPAGFRLTCYYYRGAYYKAFWADPPGCAVGEPRKKYLGERWLPLVIQNIHRYFFYIAMIFLVFLAHDVWKALWWGPEGHKQFGIGVGTLVLALNVFLLSGYTMGCHSFRHLIGGVKDKLSEHPVRSKCYDCVSFLNKRHMIWAWCSLFGVALTDVYVRLCSMHVIWDYRII